MRLEESWKTTKAETAGATHQSESAERYLYGTALDEILAVDRGGGEVLWRLADHLADGSPRVDCFLRSRFAMSMARWYAGPDVAGFAR